MVCLLKNFMERTEHRNLEIGPEPLMLCLDRRNEALLYVDAEDDEEEFEVPMSLMWRFAAMTLL